MCVCPPRATQTPGNAAYLASLVELVVQAEMDVLFAVNFAIDIRYMRLCCAVLCCAWAREQRRLCGTVGAAVGVGAWLAQWAAGVVARRRTRPQVLRVPCDPARAALSCRLLLLACMYVASCSCSFSCRVPTSMSAQYLAKLNLTDEAEMQHPEVATKINAVRREALQLAGAW